MTLPLAQDPRWQRMLDADWACPCCGQRFGGIMDISYDHPDSWQHGNRLESGEETLKAGEDQLGTDLCRHGEHRFLRGVLEIPILDSQEVFGFGVWSSLRPDNFADYIAAWGKSEEADLGPWFGWMSNALPLYGEGFLEARVQPRGGDARPAITVVAESHPLTRDQAEGISFDRLLDIYAAAGSDLRPHLETP